MTDLDRRSFLLRSAAVAGGVAVSGTAMQGIANHAAWAGPGNGQGGRGNSPMADGYGRLRPTPDQNGEVILALPTGFQYTTFSKTGATMTDGNPVPRNHDGMGAFPGPGPGTVVLVRNHEVRNGPQTSPPRIGAGDVLGPIGTMYDANGVGGTTNLVYDLRRKELLRDFVSLNGTIVNCAGGIGLGGSGWLTCEETVAGTGAGWGQKHGYTFFVPATAEIGVTPAVALTAMGRFAHEANATDPTTGVVYETEDAGGDSGFYRYVPNNPNTLSAGVLQMLRVVGSPNYDTRKGQTVGASLAVDWVTINDPDPNLEGGATKVFSQGFAQGAARFDRLEGVWYGDGSIWFCSTTGGDVENGDGTTYKEGYGQVWKYTPTSSAGGTLTLFFESPGGSFLDSPDNLVFSPKGSILLCEDDASDANLGFVDETEFVPGLPDINRLVGITPQGVPFLFAVNVFSNAEFAGGCFSPDGSTLFVNIFGDATPGSGMTCAITGPFERGPL
jgi:hypothetical protein